MRQYSLLCLLAVLTLGPIFAQDKKMIYEDHIYAKDISTVQLYLAGAQLTRPILDLKSAPETLFFEFDMMGDEPKEYWYTLIHCNADWTVSDLADNEYLKTFTEDRITEFDNSINTLTDYVHYQVKLPNTNVAWAVSGNYILKVWEEDDPDKAPVMTRRFMVTEPTWRIEAQSVRPVDGGKILTHHEIDFTVNHEGTKINNPQKDVKAYVMQNGRWDNVLGPIAPRPFLSGGETLNFDYQDLITFPAGNEFRYFDMRSLTTLRDNVKSILEKDDYYEVTLKPELNYANVAYQSATDLNGRYSIINIRQEDILRFYKNAENIDQELYEKSLHEALMECDYARVLFSLKQNAEVFGKDVYVFGELSDWQLKPAFKMQYDEAAHVYWCETQLKQGYYNYDFVVVDPKNQKIEEDSFSGNWYQTSNQYTLLTYFRPFGTRYDRLMGAVSVELRFK